MQSSPALKKFKVCSLGSKNALHVSSMFTWVGRPSNRVGLAGRKSLTKECAVLTHLKALTCASSCSVVALKERLLPVRVGVRGEPASLTILQNGPRSCV